MSLLSSYGLNARFLDSIGEAFPERVSGPGLVPARVIAASHERYRVVTGDGERAAEPTGKLRHEGELPAVGDFVAVADFGDLAVIHELLPRRTVLVRRGAGRAAAPQVLAANVDTALIVTSCDADLNAARLPRYVALARDGGVRPLVLLSKADLGEVEAALELVSRAAPGVTAFPICSLTGLGLARLREELPAASTAVLVGGSGVGKSTLVNALLGEERQVTREIRARDGRGRHATTGRELLALPWGALLIDTPGLREVGLLGGPESLEAAFADVAELAALCRFRDCAHREEPGCAVRGAVVEGRLDASRLEGLAKLRREAAARELRERYGPGGADRRRWAAVMKAAK